MIFKKSIQKNKGFTLIELLVVIAIIALLSSIVLASVSQARVKARDGQRVSEINSIQNALELYRNSVGSYPTTLTSLAPTYIPTVSIDPLGDDGSACRLANSTSNGYCYAYTPSSNPTDYHIGAQMESVDGTWTSGESNFNSSAAGWTGGFNGAAGSPNYIFDIKF